MTANASRYAGVFPVAPTPFTDASTRVAAVRARKAKDAGAAMAMLMPPYHGATLRADEASMFAHFARVAEAADLPIMLQDAPLSGVALSVPFLVRLARGQDGAAGRRRDPQRRRTPSAGAHASGYPRGAPGTRCAIDPIAQRWGR